MIYNSVSSRDNESVLSWKDSEVRLKPEESQDVRLEVKATTKKVRLEIVDVESGPFGLDTVSKSEVANRSFWLSGFEGNVENLKKQEEYVYRLHIPNGTPSGVYKVAVKAVGEVEELSVLKVMVDSETDPVVKDISVESVQQVGENISLGIWNGGSQAESPIVDVKIYEKEGEDPVVSFVASVGEINEHTKKVISFPTDKKLKQGNFFVEFSVEVDGKSSTGRLPLDWNTKRELATPSKS